MTESKEFRHETLISPLGSAPRISATLPLAWCQRYLCFLSLKLNSILRACRFAKVVRSLSSLLGEPRDLNLVPVLTVPLRQG